jgi:dTDP-4-amino-4,6-dideoxygalactose transaminase
MNMRMNELTGAVALAQLRKLDRILEVLHANKAHLKARLAGLPGLGFRRLNDETGECATLLTLLFDTADLADRFCAQVGSKPISSSGWHVYNNMEQILGKKTGRTFNCPYDCPVYEGTAEYAKHMLPQTDAILDRAVNISVGVVDKGLGAGFGIDIHSTDDAIDSIAVKLRTIILSL